MPGSQEGNKTIPKLPSDAGWPFARVRSWRVQHRFHSARACLSGARIGSGDGGRRHGCAVRSAPVQDVAAESPFVERGGGMPRGSALGAQDLGGEFERAQARRLPWLTRWAGSVASFDPHPYPAELTGLNRTN